jgi:DNA-binding MarR family transcriptional regulator
MAVTDKEFAVIREISNNHRPTQRHIAKKVGISLGLTNLIIKRLIKKGYLKIKTVPPRTIEYMLTPKGFTEKAKKSYHFTLRTINLIKTIKENIQKIIEEEYKKGAREFTISGNGELTTIAQIAFETLELKDIKLSRTESNSSKKPVCNIFVTLNGLERKIDILSELSKRGVYY